ncbi:MAG: type II toxin-antitoxin system death-on-curing family toxin [Bryobacteraceae bacterium]
MEPVFLSLDEVLEIHEQQIERYGGSAGRRDPAGLESAVATLQATFGGEFLHASIPAMAAAYLFHVCQNQAFIDGNKRGLVGIVAKQGSGEPQLSSGIQDLAGQKPGSRIPP